MTEVDSDGGGCCGILAIILFVSLIWAGFNAVFDDAPRGKCQTELGYAGQVEVVECEP